MKGIGVDAIIAEIKEGRRTNLRGWGMYAPDEDLRQVLQLLWSAERTDVIANILWIFSKRPLPTFDPRLIKLCEHVDDTVRHRAFHALAMNDHPLVRAFALDTIRDPRRYRYGAMLLIRNFVRGDEELLLEALEFPDDLDQLHWSLSCILDVLEKNEEADPSALGLVIYAHTPCQQCRRKAVRLLRDRTTLPDWMPDECRHDAEEECRKLFDEPSETDDSLSDQ